MSMVVAHPKEPSLGPLVLPGVLCGVRASTAYAQIFSPESALADGVSLHRMFERSVVLALGLASKVCTFAVALFEVIGKELVAFITPLTHLGLFLETEYNLEEAFHAYRNVRVADRYIQRAADRSELPNAKAYRNYHYLNALSYAGTFATTALSIASIFFATVLACEGLLAISIPALFGSVCIKMASGVKETMIPGEVRSSYISRSLI